MSNEAIAGALLLGFIGFTVWFNRPALPVNGLRPVETHSAFHVVGTGTQYDGTVEASDPGGAVVGRFALLDGQLYEASEDNAVHLRLTRHYDLVRGVFDVGTWAGYYGGGTAEHTDNFQAGFRYSPLRVLYDTVALDAVVSADAAGAGVSLFPPTRLVGPAWRHLGVGAWYAAPFDRGGPGWAFGVSFSVR
jgi:hypothetical protein